MSGILELGDLVPEHRPIRINRVKTESLDGPDGVKVYETYPVVLQAYYYGPRCPVVVKAQLRQIAERFNKIVQERGFSDELFQEYSRDSFMALIPGISFDEADLIAADDDALDGKCVKTLKYLNYWKFREGEDGEASVDEGEAKAETDQSTTPESSPTSA